MTWPYLASGGSSERRVYEDGALTIEAQEDGYVVTWSSGTSASEFLEAVSAWVGDSAKAELAPATNGHRHVSLGRAATLLANEPGRFTLVTVDAADKDSFIWSAVDPDDDSEQPGSLGEVGIAFSALNPVWISGLIGRTATDRIKRDIDGILKSAENLTQPSHLASA